MTRYLLVMSVLLFGFFEAKAAQVAEPQFDVPSSASSSKFNVTITCATADSSVYYTTDGTDPDENDNKIPVGGVILVSKNLTLKARGFKGGLEPSPVHSAQYLVTGLVTGGGTHALFLRFDQTVWGTGNQTGGRLGNGVTTGNAALPVRVKANATTLFGNTISAAAGGDFSLIVDDTFNIWSFGTNGSGQLGDNTTVSKSYPVRVLKSTTAGDYLTNVSELAAGPSHALAINSSGSAYAWGNAVAGRLGSGTTTGTIKVATLVRTTAGGNPVLTGAVDAAAGEQFSLVLDSNRKVWAFGLNTSGQLGQGNLTAQPAYAQTVKASAGVDLSDVDGISTGYDFAAAIRSNISENRTVWCWGQQGLGRLGNNNTAAGTISYPVKVVKAAAQGGGFLENVVELASGPTHTLALDNSGGDGSGKVWSWGDNTRGQLGDGTTTSRATADVVRKADGSILQGIVAIGSGGYYSGGYYSFSFALDKNGIIYAWGYNGNGTFGNNTVVNSNFAAPSNVVGSIQTANQPPVASLGITGDSNAPANVLLSATVSDADGQIASVAFMEDNQILSIDLTPPYSHQLVGVMPGSHKYSVIARDNLGDSTQSDASFVVNPPIDPLQNYRFTLGNGSLFSVGAAGVILASPDGANWVAKTSGTANALNALGYGNGNLVAVGASGTVLTSPDGNTWTTRSSGTTNALNGIVYGNGLHVVVGAAGTIRTSPDGVTWTARTSGTTNALNAITFINGNFIAVGVSGTIRTSTDAITWTARTSGTTNNLNGITLGKGMLVAVGASGTIRTSTDLVNWITRTSGTSNALNDVTLAGNSFVAVGASGKIILSNDGITWTSPVSGTAVNLVRVAYGYGNTVAVGAGGLILTSGDANAWQVRNSGTTNALNGVFGNSADITYQSFVVALDHQKGIGLDPMGTNASKFPAGLPWLMRMQKQTNYQMAVSNNTVAYPTAYENPLVAFGAAAGGSPLYVDQSYSFALGSGGQDPAMTGIGDFKISIYQKSDFAAGQTNVPAVATYTVNLPRKNTPDWETFRQEGYVRTLDLSFLGLVTTVEYAEGASIHDQWGSRTPAPFILTHRGTSSDYFYRIEYAGINYYNGGEYWMTVADPNNFGSGDYAFAYTLDFSDRQPWQSTSIDQPHFNGTPMPSLYQGKSVEELLNIKTPVTFQFAAPSGTTYQALDASTELRSHPILDNFVASMGNNPIALANYVLSEIKLTDAISYNENGTADEASINPPGVSRSALAVFLEKQGSPAEQCALLVYFLRKCGVNSGYVIPPDDSLKMLDAQMSKLLRMQLRGGVDPMGNTGVPHVIPVNYPWVTAYVGGKWIHIFPWLKDTSITEGYDIRDVMPDDCKNGTAWLIKYLHKDTAIRSLSAEWDNPGVLYPLYIKNTLALNHPGLGIDDLGVKIFDRKNNFTSWDQFPQPWNFSGTLAAGNLYVDLNSVNSGKLFDTVQCFVYSDRNNNGIKDSGEPNIDTGVMRAADLHNRAMVLRHTKTGANAHTMYLTLEAFRASATGTDAFTGAYLKKQQKTAALVASDDNLRFKITYNRHVALPAGFVAPSHWDSFLGLTHVRQIVDERPLRKGDTAAICMNFGQVTQEMLDVQAQKFWAAQQAILTTPGTADPDIQQGTVAYIMGMSYYKKVSDFTAQMQQLHKVNFVSFFAHGFSKLSPQRNPDGTLPNSGDINLIYPNVDMAFQRIAWAGNGTLHPDAGLPDSTAGAEWLPLLIGEISAQEHTSIKKYFKELDTVSTVKLLDLTQTAGNPMVEMNLYNYAAKGEVNYTVDSTTKKLKEWAGYNSAAPTAPSLWKSVTDVFTQGTASSSGTPDYAFTYMTPGPVKGAANTYKGMGAFIVDKSSAAALITGNMNGAYAAPIFSNTFASSNFTSMSLSSSFDYPFTLSTGGYTPSLPSFSTSSFSDFNFSSSYSGFSSGSSLLNSFSQNSIASQLSYQNISMGSGSSGLASGIQSYLNNGSLGSPSYFSNMPSLNSSYGGSGGFISDVVNTVSQWVSDPVNAVSGEFYVHSSDLKLEGPMPINIQRTYGSLNEAENEFGYGWKLAYFPYLVVASDNVLIYAAEMDGSVVAYRQQSSPTTRWIPESQDNPALSNDSGKSAGGLHNLYNNRIDKTVSGGITTYTLTGGDGSIRSFEVKSYPTPGANGLSRTRPYLQKWQDSFGNYLTFTFGSTATSVDYGMLNRITSTNGNSVNFNYDVFGHITEIFAGDGRRLTYRYDDNGDLILVTLPDGSSISYEYEHKSEVQQGITNFYSNHLITREVKPGNRILVNTYDSQRRVTEQKATVGTNSNAPVTNATFEYHNSQNSDKTWTGYTLVSDAYNKTTRYDYLNGQVTTVTDPLNQITSQEWYQPGDSSTGAYPRSLKKQIDKRGLITEYQYDSKGNRTSTSVTGDLTGDGVPETATVTATYNALNLPTQVTEPNGNYQIFNYQNPTYGYLLTSSESYTSLGMISRTVNNYENVTQSGTLFSNGLLKKVTRAFGSPDQSITSYTHNANGFITSQTQETGTSDPNVIVNFTYNLRGEMIQKTDAAGRVTSYAYDGRGNAAWEERKNSQGKLIWWNYNYYNANGEIEWSDGPRYYPEDYVWHQYDGAGRLKQKHVWHSRAKSDGSWVEQTPGDDGITTTFYQYDLFGNLTQVKDPRGNLTTMTYDDIGQLLIRSSAAGTSPGVSLQQESFTYEPGGQVATYTNPLGGVTHKYYTDSGQIRRQENPDGSVQEWRYTIDGRIAREILPNGSYWTSVYDDAARVVTRTLYNSASVALCSESKTLDRRGNVIQSVDRDGKVFSSTYDGLDRSKTVTGPAAGGSSAQQTITSIYDAAGVVFKQVNSLGETVVTKRDDLDRPSSVDTFDAANKRVRRQAYAYSQDHHAVTVIDGDGDTPLQSTSLTDVEGQGVLVKLADGSFQTSTYDRNGNQVSSRDTLGRITTSTYDALDRVQTQTLPGGAQTTYSYDAVGNTLQRLMPGNLAWNASYDSASRMLTEEEANGAQVTRSFSYSYYTSGPDTGKLLSVNDPRGLTRAYSYDAFGRVLNITSDGTPAEHDMTLDYSYDNRGNVLSLSQSGGLQPDVVVDRSYDDYGQLSGETISVNGVARPQWTQGWDSAGRRTSLAKVGAATFQTFNWRADGLLAGSSYNGKILSYTYGHDGLLKQRSNEGHTWKVTQRDALGRVLQQQLKAGNGTAQLTENLTWRADSTLNSYGAQRIGGSSWSETRTYSYDARGRITGEPYAPASGQTAALAYQFDQNTTDGLGVRTLASLTGSQIGQWSVPSSGGQDPFARVVQENASGALIGLQASQVNAAYDSAGNVTSRTLSDGRVQTITWDAMGRMVKVVQRNGSNDGFDWTAVYDGLGRRVETDHQPVTGGTASGSPVVVESSYDPQVEFLEVEATVNGQSSRKVYGPDLNGVYGGLQGIGGLDLVVDASGNAHYLASDYFGHIVGETNGSSLSWSATRSLGYGPEAGTTISILESSGDLAAATAWRGKRLDPTGFYYLGARYYEPNGGKFLSADPLGHGSSMGLYDYANGDPVNGLDPDGRFGKPAGSSGLSSFNGYAGESMSQDRQLSMVLNMIPIVGTVKQLIEGITGYDFVEGRYLSTSEQITSVAFGLLSVIPAVGLESSIVRAEMSVARMEAGMVRAELGAVRTQISAGQGLTRIETGAMRTGGFENIGSKASYLPGEVMPNGKIAGMGPGAAFEGEFNQISKQPVFANQTSAKYTVGTYNEIKGTASGLDAHHVGQKAVMGKLIPDYDLGTAPAILVPKVGHTIKGPNGIVSRNTNGFTNPRDVIARDIRELRRVYPDIPNSKLQELIKKNKEMYPIVNVKSPK